MATNSDHRAGFEASETGGLFSSLLAEEDAFDGRRTLWRVAAWGVGSVAAVVLAVMANQSALGLRREQAMTADLVQQANRLQAVARDGQNEARRLAAAVETLNSDRDRLYTRVTVLEQGLDSVTGTIARQSLAASPSAPSETSTPAPAPAVAPVAGKPTTAGEKAAAAPAEPAPAGTPTGKQAKLVPAAAAPAETKSTAAPPAPAIAPAAAKPAAPSEKAAAAPEPAPASTSAIKEVPVKPAEAPATPLVEAKSMMGPPDPAAGKLIEPSKPASATVTSEPILPVVASAPPGDSAAADTIDAALPRIQRTEFGVDVGGANSVAGLRALWRGLLKSRSTAPLAALQPIMVIREGSGGRGMQLRLVAGPLSDAATAAKLCAVLSEDDRDCSTAVYDGQRLTFRASDAVEPVKPAAPPTSRKKSAQQKRAALEEALRRPEPAPASSSWASFFGRRN